MLSLLALPLATTVALAQVEALSPDQNADFRQRLPAAIESATQPALQAYLRRLKAGTATDRAIANGVRVADDLAGCSLDADTALVHYAVPLLSPLMRVPDAYPSDGELGDPVGVVLARDQYENGSFVVFPFKDMDRVHLKLSALRADDGSVFPAENLDLRVVKVWYQNGNAWLSYFADPGLKLVPELLLHDENLIRVDVERQANYARIRTKQGTREVWISAPQPIDVGFDAYQDGFADAKTLQPVRLAAGEFKQFVLTVHATNDTKPELYRGSVQVAATGEKAYSIPVAVRVLDFQLPLPKANYDVDKDFVVTAYSVWPTLALDHKAFLPTLKNMRAHNLLHVGPKVAYDTPAAEAKKKVELMRAAGFLTKPIMNAGGLAWVSHDFDGLTLMKRMAQKYHDFYLKTFGHTDVIVNQGDEQGAAWLIAQRHVWRVLHQLGLKSGLATNTNNSFPTSAYTIDWRPLAIPPGDAATGNKWAQIGSGHTGFYANQHNGSENPAFVRRQHGILGYLANLDMVDNYQFAYGPWNDREWKLYKPMVLAYPISDGLVDTLAWEGFRAGIDDIRYATKLRQLADASIASGDLDRVEAGRKVRQWFAMIDGHTVDLNQMRMEMIEKISELTR